MQLNKVHTMDKKRTRTLAVARTRTAPLFTPRRLLTLAWFIFGMVPLLLQVRSYLKFTTPHKIAESLVVPPTAQKYTTDLRSLCPVEWLHIADIWWNIEPTHYYMTRGERLCHFIIPQYNIHGNFWVGESKVKPSSKTPKSCAKDSFPIEYYFYHGSLGYYAFYEEAVGTFCAMDKTAYVSVQGLGTFDINGAHLAGDTGSDEYRKSYWYGIFGAVWMTYRAIQMRRCYASCRSYGERCERLGVTLRRKIAFVYVQENMRLAAHDTTNYHRFVLLYLLIEGLMSDLFMLIAQDGLLAKIQYVSLGYNLSGVLLLVYEIIENTTCLREKWRVVIKRVLFCYESSLLGELLSVFCLHYFLTSLNRSSLKDSRPTAQAVSYYVWSLVGHGLVVLELIAFTISIRTLWSAGYSWYSHRTWVIFSKVSCVDTALGSRNKMVLLSGYRLVNGHLYYTAEALKAFGLLKAVEEDGSQFIVLRKMRWFALPTDNLFVIGAVAGQYVESCTERPYFGTASFFSRDLGGNIEQEKRNSSFFRRLKVSSSPTLNIIPRA